MSNYKIYDGTYLYFVTFTINNHIPLFTDAIYRDIVINSLKFSIENRSLRIFAYVIMSTHIHLIVFDAQFDNQRLQKTINEFRKFTGNALLKQIKKDDQSILEKFIETHRTDREHRIWAVGFHPIGIENEKMLVQKINYIHENPVKAGLTDNPLNWKYSSAKSWETGEEGPLPIHHYLDVGDC